MTTNRNRPPDTLDVTIDGVTITAVAVRTERGRRIWTTHGGARWIERVR